ncbi:MAG: amino acid ABC transporter permease [Kineosporiaceae bacterium]|nr:amino acid ABC transporter permease [Aeromicrobium sp.]
MDSAAWDAIQAAAGPMAIAMIKVTIPLTAICFILGLALALIVALARMSSRKYFSIPARVFISAVRGTPLLVQLFLIFYGLGQLGLKIDPYPSAVIAFSINVAGYAAEIIRASILSVPRGQWEAAETVGMGYSTTLKRIVLPQAARTAVPPLSNTLLSLLKDTSLAAVVLVNEVFRKAQEFAGVNFEYFALYSLAAFYYWVVCFVLSLVQDRLEVRLDRYVAK